MNHPDIKQASEFVLECAGWEFVPAVETSRLAVSDQLHWLDPQRKKHYKQYPTITRAMIHELVNKKSYLKNHAVYNRMPFTKALRQVLKLPLCKSGSDWEFMLIFATLADLIMAFYLAYKEG